MMQDEMELQGKLLTDWIPFPVDVSYGTNWGEL
jgi:hypothetical protein